MNKNLFPSLTFMLVAFGVFSFTNPAKELSSYGLNIDGENGDFIRAGLKPSELGVLKIYSKEANGIVEAFQITLARGNRAIDIFDVKNGQFELKRYVSMARSGDRIVIEIKNLKNENNLSSPESSILVLKII